MASEITVTLSGSESDAQFNEANAWLRNNVAATIYAAKTAGVTAGAFCSRENAENHATQVRRTGAFFCTKRSSPARSPARDC